MVYILSIHECWSLNIEQKEAARNIASPARRTISLSLGDSRVAPLRARLLPGPLRRLRFAWACSRLLHGSTANLGCCSSLLPIHENLSHQDTVKKCARKVSDENRMVLHLLHRREYSGSCSSEKPQTRRQTQRSSMFSSRIRQYLR